MLNKTTRILSIGLVLVFGVSLVSVGASEQAGCRLSCMDACRMTDRPLSPSDAMGMHQSAATGACCSGPDDVPCDVESSSPLDNPLHSVSLSRVPTGDPSGMGMITGNIPAGNAGLGPSGPRPHMARTPRSSPIYLHNLSLLI